MGVVSPTADHASKRDHEGATLHEEVQQTEELSQQIDAPKELRDAKEETEVLEKAAAASTIKMKDCAGEVLPASPKNHLVFICARYRNA